MSCSYGQIKTPSSYDLASLRSYEQKRAVHDNKRMNYYDHLQYNAQKERTKINSAPTIKKYTTKGDIRHEPQTPTTKSLSRYKISIVEPGANYICDICSLMYLAI